MNNEKINNPEVQEIVHAEIHKDGTTVEGIKKSVKEEAGVVITENEEILNLIKEYPNATAEELKIATNIVEETTKAIGVEEAKVEIAASMLLTVDQTPESEIRVESKENFPEGHILNPKTFEKIAMLEAMDENGNFSQARYDSFVAQDAKSGEYTFKFHQDRLNNIFESEGKVDDYEYQDSIIYGNGGWNRYGVDENGIVYARKDVMTGSPDLKAKMEAKAIEFGIGVKDR